MNMTKAQFLVAKAQEIQRDIDFLNSEVVKGAHIEERISVLGQYDRTVQRMISVHPDLAEEWKAFERAFESHAGERPLRTAEEKINNKQNTTCTGCGSIR